MGLISFTTTLNYRYQQFVIPNSEFGQTWVSIHFTFWNMWQWLVCHLLFMSHRFSFSKIQQF